MATTKLKFYRGLKARYDAASKHLDAIYFATDTKELLMNGVNYGGSGVTDVSFDKGSNKLIVTKSSGKTEYDLTELIRFKTSLPDSLATPSKLGGLPAGTKVETLKTKTLSQIFEDILFEEIQPTVQAPSATISFKSPFTANKILEVGESAPTSEQIQTGFNRGNCTVVGQANKNRAGELISDDQSFIYVGNSTSNKTLPTKVTLGTMQYNYQAHHGAGDTLLTSKGNKATVSPNPLPEGTVKSGAVYLYGTYPFYCNGSSASTSAGDTNFPSAAAPDTKLPLQKWTDTLIGAKFASEAATGTRLEFYFPSEKNVSKVEFYNTVSGKWEVFGTDKYTVSDAGNKTVQSVQIAYKKLTTTGAMSGALQLRFTVSDAGKKLVDEPDTYNGEEITDEVIAMLARNSREVPFAMPMNNVMPMASTTGNRPAGVASFAVNFEPGGQAPLDARQLVPNKTDLIAAATYSGKNTYNGMLVVVGDNGDGKPALYVLKDMTKITKADYGGWIRLDVGAQTLIQIINDLTTGGTNKALSAEQGKVLKGLVDTLTNKVNALGAVYVPKGTLADLSALKGVSSVSKGHVYNVTAEVTLNGKKYPAETNFVYIGETANQASVETNWDSLGGTVDLTAYAKKADLEGFLTEEDLAGYAKAVDVANTYATKAALSEAIEGLSSTYATKAELTSYATNETLKQYATKQDLDDAFAWNEETE